MTYTVGPRFHAPRFYADHASTRFFEPEIFLISTHFRCSRNIVKDVPERLYYLMNFLHISVGNASLRHYNALKCRNITYKNAATSLINKKLTLKLLKLG